MPDAVSWTAAEAHDALASERYAAAVRDDQREGKALGVHAVPTCLVDSEFGTTGAQPPEALWMLMQHAWQKRSLGT